MVCRLKENVVTPTTKAVDHDVPISPEDIVAQGLVSQQDWDMVSTKVLILHRLLLLLKDCTEGCTSPHGLASLRCH